MATGGVIFYKVHRVLACQIQDVLLVMYIGLESCVSLCFTFGIVVNKFTAGGFMVTRVYNFDLAKQSSVNSHVPSRLTWPLRCSPTWLL